MGARQLLMTNLPGPPLNLQTRLCRCAVRWPFVSVSIQVLVVSRSLIQPLMVFSLMPFFLCFAMLTNKVNSPAASANNLPPHDRPACTTTSATASAACRNQINSTPTVGSGAQCSIQYRPCTPASAQDSLRLVKGPGFNGCCMLLLSLTHSLLRVTGCGSQRPPC